MEYTLNSDILETSGQVHATGFFETSDERLKDIVKERKAK
jgi:hypothetical protein